MEDFFDINRLTNRNSGPDTIVPRFYMAAEKNEYQSNQQGRPVFDSVEMVEMIIMGDNKNRPVQRVADEHRDRWPQFYAKFKAGQEQSADGTPLEQWPMVTVGQVFELKAARITTVEQLAAVVDSALPNLGMGARTLRDNAIAWLDRSKGTAEVSKLIKRAEDAEFKALEMQEQMAELRRQIDELRTAQGPRRRSTMTADG